MLLKPGQVVRFTYQHAVVDAHSGDKNKTIIVLHPHWRGKVHGIDLARLSTAEREVLEIVFTWDGRKDKLPHRIPLVNDIMNKMMPNKDVQNPVTFYAKFVKPFLSGKDAYRMYYPGQMSGVTVVKNARISTGKPPNAKPLFKKPETQAKDTTLSPAQQRLAALKSKQQSGAPKPAEPAAQAKSSMHAQPPIPAAPAKPSSTPSAAADRLAALKAKSLKKP